MKIHVENFYSIKVASFEILPGISVLAGKNGAGKSQLLAAIASVSDQGPQGVSQFGFIAKQGEKIQIDPTPKVVLWRPPIRRIGEAGLSHDFIPLQDTNGFINITSKVGYSHNLDNRFTQIHTRLCNHFLAGSIPNAKEYDKEIWRSITNSFERVFKKTLAGAFDIRAGGAKVGLLLENREISKFGQLSSGEREFISLILDILTAESEVEVILIDEIESHFHPDLQRKVLEEIKQVSENRIILATTQSPAVMVTADPDKLFFLKHHSEVGLKGNQIVNVSSDLDLIDSLSNIYAGFGSDVRLLKHFSFSANQELLHYAVECTRPSEIKGQETGGDHDPQVASFRSTLLNLEANATIIEYGVGRGRLLGAFKSVLDDYPKTWTYIAIDIDVSNEEEVTNYIKELGLAFYNFKFEIEPPKNHFADLTVFANVLHEVGPQKIPELLSGALRQAKAGSTILILEALQLAVGEKLRGV